MGGARNFGLKGHFQDPAFDQKIHCGIRENGSYLTENSLQIREAGLAKT